MNEVRNGDHEIEASSSGHAYLTMEPGRTEDLNARLLEDPRVFAYRTYAEEIHPPVEVLPWDLDKLANENLPRCLDMPLRLSGQEDYRLPIEWASLRPLLERLMEIEHGHNESWRDYNTYLTVDSKEVRASEQQRHGGLHVDGFQGERIREKTKVTRNYVASSNGGTHFYPQRFIVADPAYYNVFEGFDLQGEQRESATENVFYFMDAYSVHESGFAERDGTRLFVRLTYDLKIFDRLGNTRNSALTYEWPMVARHVADELARPRLTDIVDSPYFPNPS